jgi:hypothetical protein
VPPLLGCGVCPPADERDGGAEAAADLRSSGRTPQPLPVGTVLGDRVLDQLSEEVDDRWWRYGGVSFAGVHAAQYWVEFILWETLLNERPYKAIIELGTWEGGFSLYLSSQAEHRDMSFRTYDIHKPARFVLCDGGNKPRELKTFARYVTPASTLVVHDWGTEMLPKDVPPGVEMIHEDWCVDLGSASRVFRKLPYA